MKPVNSTAASGATEIEVPAHLAVYVETLGIDLAMTLFLAMGGSQIYLSRRSGDHSLMAQTIGAEAVERLAARLDYNYIKVPLARRWVAQVMRAQGQSDNEIARIVRADVATVRRWLGPRSQGEQYSLHL